MIHDRPQQAFVRRNVRWAAILPVLLLAPSAPGQWDEDPKLLASDGADDDFFGGAVDVNGDLAIVGAAQNDEGGENSGTAYIFRFDGTTWTEEQMISASDAATADSFGSTVA
ncbi:MAG: FG-GAP repeat protein, partial [Planctomycetota bacterium]